MRYHPLWIINFIEKDLIALNVEVKDKKDLFKRIADMYKNAGVIENRENVYNTLVEAGINRMRNRVAVLDFHYDDTQKERFGIVILKNRMKFNNSGNKTFRLMFIIAISPMPSSCFAKAIKRWIRLIKHDNVITKIISATFREEVIDIIHNADRKYGSIKKRKKRQGVKKRALGFRSVFYGRREMGLY